MPMLCLQIRRSSWELAELCEELKSTRRQLEETAREGRELARWLEAAEGTFEDSQSPVSEMWQFLRPTRFEPAPSEEMSPDGDNAPDPARIEGQIADVREWARRRSRHWNRAV